MADLSDKLKGLADLLREGLLTREEFDQAKLKLLGGDSAPSTSSTADLSGPTRMAGAAEVEAVESDPMALQSGGPASAPAPAAPSDEGLTVGATLAERYIITRKLGEGGMGQVFLAMDKDTEQDVAVKIIAPRLAGDPAMLKALRREVATARGLGNHPNLLRILDVHLRETPPFISMEVASGGDLEEYWLAQTRRLEVEDTSRLLEQILAGLHSLHESRVVHQDIKPQNILLARDGSVRITDYGISRSIKDQVRAGGVDGSGTLAYMAPEQLAGKICDRRADLYSVGIMAYRLLTGCFPFSATTEDEIEAWHRSGSRELGELPHPFDAVIPRLIAIDPNARFRKATEVIKALRAPATVENLEQELGLAPVTPRAHSAPETSQEPEAVDVLVTWFGSNPNAVFKALGALGAAPPRLLRELMKTKSLSTVQEIRETPPVVMAGVDLSTARQVKKKLQAVGATVEIRPVEADAERPTETPTKSTGLFGGLFGQKKAASTPAEGSLDARLEAMRSQHGREAPTQHPSTSVRKPPADPLAVIQSVMGSCLVLDDVYKKVFVAPDIPSKKLAAAIKAFGRHHDVKAKDVCLLWDMTHYGDCEYGLLLTRDSILLHNPRFKMNPALPACWKLPYSEIESVEWLSLVELGRTSRGVPTTRTQRANLFLLSLTGPNGLRVILPFQRGFRTGGTTFLVAPVKKTSPRALDAFTEVLLRLAGLLEMEPEPKAEPTENTPSGESFNPFTLPNNMRSMAGDLDLVFDDPGGLALHRTKDGKRWFATQAGRLNKEPQTHELTGADLSQLKKQLAGSPYWVKSP